MSALAFIQASDRGVTIAAVRDHVAGVYGVTVADMLSLRRESRLDEARKVAMFIARRRTCSSLPVIGKAFGDRDHTTILGAVRRVEQRLLDSPSFAAKVTAIESELLSNSGVVVESACEADAVDLDALAKALVEDPGSVGQLTLAAVRKLAARFLDQQSDLRAETKTSARRRTKLMRAVTQRARLDKAIGEFLDRTDGIRTAPGEEDRFLAREAQHAAFKALRGAFETTEKETLA